MSIMNLALKLVEKVGPPSEIRTEDAGRIREVLTDYKIKILITGLDFLKSTLKREAISNRLHHTVRTLRACLRCPQDTLRYPHPSGTLRCPQDTLRYAARKTEFGYDFNLDNTNLTELTQAMQST